MEKIDYPARHGGARRIMKAMGKVAWGNLSEEDTDKFFEAFLEFDDHFIAPHIATDPARAALGYELLERLMTLSAQGAFIEAHFERWADDDRSLRERQWAAGKGRGKQMRADIKWALYAEELAREIKEENASIGAAGIASRVLKRWKRTDIEKPNREQLRGYIRRTNKAHALPSCKD
jgi:hypothetical protein